MEAPSTESLRICRRGVRNIHAAAEFIGGSESLVWELIKDRTVSSFRRGKHRVVPVVDLVRYLAGIRDEQEDR